MFKFLPTTALPGFRVGLADGDEPGFTWAPDGPPPVLPGAADTPIVDDNYPFGATSVSFNAPQTPVPDPAAPPGIGLPLPTAANQTPADPTPSAGSSPLNPRGFGGAFNYARYVPDNPINQAEPVAEPPNTMQKASGGTDLSPIGSAQAQTPQAQQPGTSLKIDPSPGEAVVLPDGSTVADPSSATGKLMSPVTDLTAVAAAGRAAGMTFRAMLDSPETAAGAFPYLGTMLGVNLGHAGTFDYQRRGNMIAGYTQPNTPMSRISMWVCLPNRRACHSGNSGGSLANSPAISRATLKRMSPYCLHPEQLQYITMGYKTGQSGMFDPPATP